MVELKDGQREAGKPLPFGYKCQECGRGTVREQVFPAYQTKVKGVPVTVKDARIGVCDQCGAQHFDPNETMRWRGQLAGPPADAPTPCACKDWPSFDGPFDGITFHHPMCEVGSGEQSEPTA